MNPRFVRKGIGAHHCLIRRHLRPRDFREHSARTKKFFQTNLRGHSKTLFAHRQSNHDLFQRSISRALADAVDGALNLPHPGANCRQRVRHCQTQVVVAMRAQRDAVWIAQVFAHSREHRAILFRHRISHGIRQIQYRCAGIHRYAAYLAQEIDIRPSGIFGGELHLSHVLPAVPDHGGDCFQCLLAGHVQLYAKVQIGCREENMQSWRGRRFQRLDGRAHILFLGPRQRRNRHIADFLRYHLHRFKVAP